MNMLPVDIERRDRASAIRQRHQNGEFDASDEESDDWAQSEDGEEAFAQLIGGKK
jgi:hypothetical protein